MFVCTILFHARFHPNFNFVFMQNMTNKDNNNKTIKNIQGLPYKPKIFVFLFNNRTNICFPLETHKT